MTGFGHSSSAGTAGGGDRPAGPDPYALARDWITLWQSELAAAAQDREVQEAWAALLAVWAGSAEAMLAFAAAVMPPGAAPDDARTHDAARAAAAAAASDARDDEIGRLAGRIAELERRLAELERVNSDPGDAGS
jgi:hypothetical protein